MAAKRKSTGKKVPRLPPKDIAESFPGTLTSAVAERGLWWEPTAPTEVEPELILREMSTGRNQPIAVADAELVNRCVVKLGMPEPASSLNEWVSASIIRALGLATPRSLVVRLSAEFIAVLPARFRDKVPKPCTIYGSCFIENLQPHSSTGDILRQLRPEAWRLLGLDAFIHNIDRRKGNENLGICDGRFMAYDHELALAFLKYIPADDDTAGGESCESWIRTHTFSNRFGGIPMPTEIGTDVRLFDDLWFEALESCTPPEWLAGSEYKRIRTVLSSRSIQSGSWLPRVAHLCTT